MSQHKEAVLMVRTLRAELGTDQGTSQPAAAQLGNDAESVRLWVRQADVDEQKDASVSGQDTAENISIARPSDFVSRGSSVVGWGP